MSGSLDIATDLLNKFGGSMGNEHAVLKDNLLPLLEDARASIRKRAVYCLGAHFRFMMTLDSASRPRADA